MAAHSEDSPLYLPHHHTCSVLNRGLVELPHDRDTATVWEVTHSLLSSDTTPPSDVLEYISLYTGSTSAFVPTDQLSENFHLVRKYGLMLPKLFPEGVIFRDQSTISLSIPQIKCLLSHLVLGSLQRHLDWRETYTASLYYATVLLSYLSLDIDQTDRCVTCSLHSTAPSHWDQLPWEFPPADTFKGTIEDNPCGNKVVFSNKYFGQGPGGTQEELIFGSYPEACVFPLFFSRPLKDPEVVLISHVLRVAKYSGYGKDVGFKCFLDPLAESHTLLLMDALEVDMFGDKMDEFNLENINRELNKCFCGFSQFTGGVVATGKWGCGAFGGNFDLKKRIQQFAAQRANVNLVFCHL